MTTIPKIELFFIKGLSFVFEYAKIRNAKLIKFITRD